MIWFFIIVFMVLGQLPVEKRIVEFPAGKQACIDGKKELMAKLSKAGQGYIMSECEPKRRR